MNRFDKEMTLYVSPKRILHSLYMIAIDNCSYSIKHLPVKIWTVKNYKWWRVKFHVMNVCCISNIESGSLQQE